MSRFAIAHTAVTSRPFLSRPLRLLIGNFATRSYLDVTTDQVDVGFGRIGLTVQRAAISSVERVDYPPRVRVGWRKNRRRTLSLVAAPSPVVRLRLDPPAVLRVLGIALGIDELDVTVADPAGLLAELRAPIGVE